MTDLNDFREMGRANAEMAIDQAGDDLEDSIANYYDNVWDTVREMGVKEDRTPECYAAHDGFIAVLVKHGIEFRP